MRAVVAIKGSGRGGASNAARYIAESKLDPEREGEDPRGLFTERNDGLTYRKADRYLSGGQLAPEKNDLIHFSVSFQEEDFAQLGSSDEERKQNLRGVARKAMDQLKSELGASDWRWAAGVHLNTNHPHLHILIHKEIVDRKTDKPRRIGKIPKQLLAHRESLSNGDSRPIEGVLGKWFLEHLDRAKQPKRETTLDNPKINRDLAEGEKSLSTSETLLRAAAQNPSIAGRELLREIIERGPAPEPEEPPDVRNPRVAFQNRSLDDPEYRAQPEQADWLGRESRDLRDLYERGASVVGDVLVLPAEEHELSTPNDEPFIASLAYAHDRIGNAQLAQEFHTLAHAIAGETADAKDALEIFRYYYDRSSQDESGRYLKKDQIAEREAALDRTLGEMRALAGEMAKLETRESIEVALPTISLDARPDGSDAEFAAPTYNIAARKAGLPDESLRFPAGLEVETSENIVKHLIAPIDAMIEEGAQRNEIRTRMQNALADFYERASEEPEARNAEQERSRVSVFLHSYLDHRLRDPETRALNRSEAFRQARERLNAARTPEELNQTAEEILRRNLERGAARSSLNARERNILFFGRAPDHHTAEMRELRYSWGLSRDERAEKVRALHSGEATPSPALDAMLAELRNRSTGPALRHYRASILNQQMRNPGKVDLRSLHERLPKYERDFLFQKIQEREKTLAPAQVSLRESAPRVIETPPAARPMVDVPRREGALHQYKAAIEEIETRLTDQAVEKKSAEASRTDLLLTREEKRAVRAQACNLAWERLEASTILTTDPAVIQLLSLNEAIDRLREETQPRAREAAQKLDEMIREKNLDRGINEKTDFYYGSRHLSDEIRGGLAPGERRLLQILETAAASTQKELERGFQKIDSVRAGVQRIREGGEKTARSNRTESGSGDANRNSGRSATEFERDRRILGDAILKAAQCDCAVLDFETARDHGETFRFKIYDASLKAERRISSLDVERRAGARANRAADSGFIQSADDRQATLQQVADRELSNHERTLKEHETRLRSLVMKLDAEAKGVQDAYARAERLAQKVAEKYERRGEALPSPFAERKALMETLEKSIDHRFAGHAEKLEGLRGALAEEHRQPLRSDREAARLGAQLFVAQTKRSASQERVERFERTRHLTKWEIGDEKLSLADVDRRIERSSDEAKLIGRFSMHLDPIARKQASLEIERLTELRKEILARIEERATELREKAEEAGKLISTLDEANRSESLLRAGAGQGIPEPEFLRKEIERAADNIETARDPGLLQRLDGYETRFDQYADKAETLRPQEIEGRALGREVRAEIFHRENLERMATFELRRDLQPVLMEKPDGSPVTYRMLDLQPRTVVELAFRPLVETPAGREFRGQVQNARDEQQNQLAAEIEKTKEYLDAAREIAEARTAKSVGDRSSPLFTSKQAMEIEIYAERLPDSQERSQYLSLAREGTYDPVTSINPANPEGSNSTGDQYAPERETIEIAAGRGR